MATVAQIAAWRDDLLRARLSGVREVTDQNGERIRYGSDSEMARAIAEAERLLAGRAPTTIRFTTSKGLHS